MANSKTHYRACNVCEATCGLEIKYQDNEILSIKGDKNDPLSKGHICPKGVALQDVYYDPDRLKQPLMKTADGWQKISWDKAFKQVAKHIKKIQKEHGKDAVALYFGNPTVHNLGAMLFLPMFSKMLKTKNRYSATSLDQLPDQLAAYLMFGHQLMVPVPDLDRTQCLLIIGANPVVSNGSMMTAPKVAQRLKDIKKRGGKIINVDPRFTETSKISDQHIFITPATDVYLLLAMINEVFNRDLVDIKHVEKYLQGFAEIETLVKPYTPANVADITGIDATIITDLVATFCQASSACCYTRFGASTQKFGTLTQWLGNVLNIITGNIDKEGGVMFSKPAVDILASARRNKGKKLFAKFHSRIRKLPSFMGELPVSTLAEEILTEGDGQIKMLISNSGNPVLSTPNGQKMDQALASLDYMVAIDFYLNESSRHANIILPPTSALERPHYNLAFHTLAIQNTAKYSDVLFKPAENTRSDMQIFTELWSCLQPTGVLDRIKTWYTKRVIYKKGEAGMVDMGLQKGPYAGLNLKKLKAAKHGLDLGALKPCLPDRLFTVDKQIHLFPEEIKTDMDRMAQNFENAKQQKSPYDMLLIGRRDPRTNNSWMHNSHRLVKGKPRCLAIINKADAQKHQLQEGDSIKVVSQTNELVISVTITENIKAGIISIPHGWGHNQPDTKLSIANKHPGVNINNLMNDTEIDELSGNAVLAGVPIRIEVIRK
jgi:anaerobic selenocysteine-containing dehydrogenase